MEIGLNKTKKTGGAISFLAILGNNPTIRSIGKSILPIISILPPIYLFLIVLETSVNVPFWDEWDHLLDIFMSHNGNLFLLFENLWRGGGEHPILFPRMLIFIVGSLTHLNLTYLHLFNLGLIFVNFTIIYLGFSKSRNTASTSGQIFFLVSAFLIFSPTQIGVVIWGLSSYIFLTIMAVLGGFYIFSRKPDSILSILAQIILVYFASFSSLNGLVFSALILFYWLILFSIHEKRKPAFILLLFAAQLASIIYILVLKNTQSYLHEFLPDGILPFVYWVVEYVGSSLSMGDHDTGYYMGVVGLMGFGLALFYSVKKAHQQKQSIPSADLFFLLVMSFSAGTAVLTALGREGEGVSPLSNRYLTYSLLFWVGFAYFATRLWGVSHKRRLLKILIALVLFVVLYENYITGSDSYGHTRNHITYKRLAMESLITGRFTGSLDFIYPDGKHNVSAEQPEVIFLKENHLGPFYHPDLSPREERKWLKFLLDFFQSKPEWLKWKNH